MHAFLVIGNNRDQIEIEIERLQKKLSAKLLEFPLAKIEDARELNKFLKLGFNEPTLIVINNINNATDEALNAFLKNLEEPGENIYFVLTAPTHESVLPTIVSRCEIIKITDYKKQITDNEQITNFLNSKLEQRIQFFDKFKERGDAINFIEDLIFYLHDMRDFSNLEVITETLTRLKANANVNLQLTNLAIKYE